MNPAIHRIVWVLDSTVHKLHGLELITSLAATYRAELKGIFIEDVTLLELSALPLSAIDTLSGKSRPLDRLELQRLFQRQAHLAQLAFQSSAERLTLSWAFEVIKGYLVDEVARIAPGSDFIMLQLRPQTTSELTQVLNTLLEQTRVPLLLPGKYLKAGSLLVYDDAQGLVEAIPLGAAILHKTSAPSSSQAGMQQQQNALRVRHLPKLEAQGMLRIYREEGGLIILSDDVLHRQLTIKLAMLGLPVLIVRKPKPDQIDSARRQQ